MWERDTTPLFVFDAGYDPVKLQRELLRDRPVQLLVRLHSNRVFYADPEDPVPRPVGRPRRHGERFDLGDPETWPDPSAEHRCESEDYGSVRVRAWADLHPKTRRIGERYGCEKTPVVKGTVVLAEVDRLPKETRKPKKLWLWWHGEGEPDLNLLWRAYCRRFSLEHAIRSRRIYGHGSSWPHTLSSDSRGELRWTGGYRGRNRCLRGALPRHGC